MTETRIVEKKVEVIKPLPVQLTRPLEYPPGLPDQFTMQELVEQLFSAYDLIDQANEDRARAARLTAPPQPEEPAR